VDKAKGGVALNSRVGAFLLAATAIGGFYAASAFDAGTTGSRGVTATVVGDANAYIGLSINVSSPNKCFMGTQDNGNVFFNFATNNGTCAANGGGTGINTNSTYYYDNLMNLTNQGTQTRNLYVNTSSTTGTVYVCVLAPASLPMTKACYSQANGPFSVAVGGRLNVGVAVYALNIGLGSSVSGNITVDAVA